MCCFYNDSITVKKIFVWFHNSFVMPNKINGVTDVLTRRTFFKKCSTSVLAMIALPVTFVACTPDDPLIDVKPGCQDCTNACKGTCLNICKDTCKGGCKESCKSTCKDYCNTHCSAGCTNSCQGSCRGDCSYTCSGDCSGTSK